MRTAQDDNCSYSLPRDTDGQLSAFVWPGGYQVGYLDRDNSTLCAKCARTIDVNPDIHEGDCDSIVVAFSSHESDSCDTCEECNANIGAYCDIDAGDYSEYCDKHEHLVKPDKTNAL